MKQKTVFYCTECGNETAKWAGRCPACGAWNTLTRPRHRQSPARLRRQRPKRPGGSPRLLSELDTQEEIRFTTGVGELDRVLGRRRPSRFRGAGWRRTRRGQVHAALAAVRTRRGLGAGALCDRRGESASTQDARPAPGRPEGEIYVLAETQLAEIEAQIESVQPTVVIVDSIQTMFDAEIAAAPGSVSQVRECTMSIMRLAKADGFTAFVVGHINKEGNIAGPKVLEHMVDCVLYFEGEQSMSYRILRAAKNRFGSTNEIGVFEMADNGLREVPNPRRPCSPAARWTRPAPRHLRHGGHAAHPGRDTGARGPVGLRQLPTQLERHRL